MHYNWFDLDRLYAKRHQEIYGQLKYGSLDRFNKNPWSRPEDAEDAEGGGGRELTPEEESSLVLYLQQQALLKKINLLSKKGWEKEAIAEFLNLDIDELAFIMASHRETLQKRKLKKKRLYENVKKAIQRRKLKEKTSGDDPPLSKRFRRAKVRKAWRARKKKETSGEHIVAWTLKERLDEAVKLCLDHPKWSYAKIAKIAQLPAQQVRDYCIEKGARAVAVEMKNKSQMADPDLKAEAIRLCRETTLTYKEISKIVGYSANTINTWCIDAGARKRQTKRYVSTKSLPQEIINETLRLCRETKLSYVKIAGKVRLTKERVRKICLEHGAREKKTLKEKPKDRRYR